MKATPRTNAFAKALAEKMDNGYDDEWYDWMEYARQLERELAALPEGVEQERKVVGYMNERGGIMTEKDYWEHTNTPAWKWVIDQHWTPVAPVYAGDFIDRPSPQNEPRKETE